LCAWLGCAVLGVATPASAFDDISIRPAAEAPVELLRPAPGEALASNRPSTIEWRARRDLAAEGLSEWEAFLSFDGGRTWPVRATPHLDITVSRFSFVIPMVPSDDVRIMLRFGDERREVGYVLPTVHRSVGARSALMRQGTSEPTLEVGEIARPGVRGVVLWVDGARDGRRLVTRSSALRPGAASRAASGGRSQWPFVTPPRPHALRVAVRTETWSFAAPPGPAGTELPTSRSAFPLLLLLCRRNE